MQILQYVHLHANVCVCVCVSRERQRHRDSVCYRCIGVPGTVGCVSYVALVLKGLQ